MQYHIFIHTFLWNYINAQLYCLLDKHVAKKDYESSTQFYYHHKKANEW